MKQFFSITIIFIFHSFFMNLSAQSNFVMTYGDPIQNDAGNSILQTFDGNFVFTGYTTCNNPVGDICVIKMAANGDTLWTKLIGDTIRFRNSLHVVQLRDSGFIVSGYNTVPNGVDDLYLLRLDSLGNIIWTRKYGTALGADIINVTRQTHDNNFIAVGSSFQSDGTGGCCGKALIIKFDSFGDTLWTRTIINVNDDWFVDFKETSDSNFILAGVTNDTVNLGRSYVSLTKINDNGAIIWQKQILLTRFSRTYSLELDSNYILVGGVSEGNSQNSMFLLKTDSTGNPLWCKTYGTISNADRINYKSSFSKSMDSNYYLITNYTDSIGDVSRILMIKTDSNGDTLLTKVFSGTTSYVFANQCSSTSDAGVIICGTACDSGGSACDILVLKTDSNGVNCFGLNSSVSINTISPQVINRTVNVTSGLNQSQIASDTSNGCNLQSSCLPASISNINLSNNTFEVFPNPSKGHVNILLNMLIKKATIDVYNILGKKVYSTNWPDPYSITHQIQLDVASGIYMILISGPGFLMSEKIVLE